MSAEVVVAALAAFVAAAALFHTWAEGRNRAAFEHLREVERRLQPVWRIPDITQVEDELKAWFTNSGSVLSQDAEAYLSLLTALDLLAFASMKGMVSEKPVRDWLRSLLQNESAVTAAFLVELQACCKDEAIYEHLLKYIREEFAELLDSQAKET